MTQSRLTFYHYKALQETIQHFSGSFRATANQCLEQCKKQGRDAEHEILNEAFDTLIEKCRSTGNQHDNLINWELLDSFDKIAKTIEETMWRFGVADMTKIDRKSPDAGITTTLRDVYVKLSEYTRIAQGGDLNTSPGGLYGTH